jgi:hypothetical protein
MLRCRSATRTLLEGVVVSIEEWLRRRIIIAYSERSASDNPFSIADVKRKLTIMNTTYAKHEKLIEHIIVEEWNKDLR